MLRLLCRGFLLEMEKTSASAGIFKSLKNLKKTPAPKVQVMKDVSTVPTRTNTLSAHPVARTNNPLGEFLGNSMADKGLTNPPLMARPPQNYSAKWM